MLKVFDNTTGFRPSGRVLKYWALLPQVSTSIDKEQIPSLFGNLKNISVPVLMVILLIVFEGILMYQLNDEGVGYLVLEFDFTLTLIAVLIVLQVGKFVALATVFQK